tara:strand:- start:3011 stop:4234 length:1224 start_codon:yes stop_codon:yes gene_type:complete
MNSEKLLSIIIPVFNKEKLLNKCIGSIYKLKKFSDLKNDIEVIAINDCSKDNSYFLLNKWKKKIKNFKIINLKTNKGVSFSRNIGIKKSTGNYILFVDADDTIKSKNFKNIFFLIKRNQSKDIFLFYNIIQNGKIIIKNKIDKSKNEKSFSDALISTNSNLTSWNIWRTIIKRKFITNNKIYFENLHQFEDWVYIAKLILLKPKFFKIKDYLYCYNLKINNSETRSLDIKNLINSIKTFDHLKKINLKFNYQNKVLKLMIDDIKKILFIDFFLLNQFHIKLYRKKYPLLKGIIETNIEFRNIINKSNNNILFCAGRFGRTLSNLLSKKIRRQKIIIDENPTFYNSKINGFKIKNFNFIFKNRQDLKKHRFIICNTNRNTVMAIEKKILGKKFTSNQIISINKVRNFK